MVDGLSLKKDLVSYNAALRACAKGAQWQHAVEVLRSLRASRLQGDSVTYRTAIGACRCHWGYALALLQDAQGMKLDMGMSSYGVVMSACQSASCWKEALQVFAAAAQASVQADARSFTSAISSGVRGEDWQGAVARFCEMLRKGVETDSIVQNAGLLAKGFLLWQAALQQLGELEQTFLRADAASYNTVLSACEGHWQECLVMVVDMEQKAIKKTVVSMGALLSGKNELSESWGRPLELLVSCYRRSAETNVISHTNLLAGMAASWFHAAAYFSSLSTRGVAKTLPMETAALNGLRAAGRWRQVLHVAAAARERDQAMSHMVVDSHISASQWWHGVQACTSLARRSLEPSLLTVNLAVSAGAALRQWHRGLGFLSSRSLQDVRTVNGALHSASENGQWSLALTLLQNLALSALEASVVSYSTAMTACGAKGSWPHVLLLLNRLEGQGLEATTIVCNSAIVSCAGSGSGSWRFALSLFGYVPSASGPDTVSFDGALQACEAAGRWRAALQLLSDLQACGLQPEVPWCFRSEKVCHNAGSDPAFLPP